MPMRWKMTWPTLATFHSSRGYFSRLPLLSADIEKDDVSEDSTSEDIDTVETPASFKRPGRIQCAILTIPYILAAVIFVFQIAGIVLLWSGKVYITFPKGPGLPPYMELETPVQFVEYREYAAWTPDHGTPAWRIQTANMDVGRVFVKHAETYGLKVPDWHAREDDYTMFPMALYHQLHCLGTIREVFYTLNISEELAYGPHLGHCFDYLRQSLWCAGDLTLEYTASGWNVAHLCKDPHRVVNFMEAHGHQPP